MNPWIAGSLLFALFATSRKSQRPTTLPGAPRNGNGLPPPVDPQRLPPSNGNGNGGSPIPTKPFKPTLETRIDQLPERDRIRNENATRKSLEAWSTVWEHVPRPAPGIASAYMLKAFIVAGGDHPASIGMNQDLMKIPITGVYDALTEERTENLIAGWEEWLEQNEIQPEPSPDPIKVPSPEAVLSQTPAPATAPQETPAPTSAPKEADLDVAKRLVAEGDVMYKAKDYEGARLKYEEAYELTGIPALLFNIAQCYRLLGKKEDAIKLYQEYIKEEPESPYREETEGFIAKLKGEGAVTPAPAPAPSAPAPTPAPHPEVKIRKFKTREELSPREREIHDEARARAIEAQKDAAELGASAEERAAIYLQQYIREDGMLEETIAIMQENMHVTVTGKMDAETLQAMEDLGYPLVQES